jgi:hypothetical protein
MIRAYDRANAYAIAGEKQLADFIETGGEPFDPRITYDHYSQRFLITALGAGLNLLASPKSPQKVEFLNSFKVAGPNEFGDPTKWHRANTPAFFTPPCGGPHFAD